MILSFAEQVSAVPNVSYLSLPARTFIEQKLADADFTPKEKANIKTERQYCHDEYGIYARIKRGNPPRRMLVVMHLDHPGIVLDGTGSGKVVGSLGTERLQAHIDQEGPIPVRTYTYDGNPMEPNTITRVKASGKVTVAHARRTDRNAHAIWDMPTFQLENGKIKMLNADDMIHAAIIFQVITTLKQISDPVDVVFIFTALEEVRQAAATGIAKRGSTPFGQITLSTYITVLEAGMASVPSKYELVLKSMNLSFINYDHGVIIGINDQDVVYGERFPGVNGMESLLLHAAHELPETQRRYQHTIDGGACDATAFTLFAQTPHIASLTIPTLNKHNWGPNGEIDLEELSLDDATTTAALLTKAILHAGQEKLPNIHQRSLCEKLKTMRFPKNNQLRGDLERAHIHAAPRLRRGGILYPTDLVTRTEFLRSSLRARLPL